MFGGKDIVIFDIEADGLNATKIHCATVNNLTTGSVWSMIDYNKIKEFFTKEDIVLVAHNGLSYDKPTLERILGIKVKAELIDTLGLSWYLYPDRVLHGLDAWGEEFGVPKPEVKEDEWKGLSDEELSILEYCDAQGI